MLRKKSQVKINRSYRKKKTELKPQEKTKLPLIAVTISLITLSAVNIVNTLRVSLVQPETVLAQTTSIDDEKAYWVDFLSTHSDYLPGILELAKIEYQMGDTNSAEILLGTAKIVNPNDETLKTTLKELGKTK